MRNLSDSNYSQTLPELLPAAGDRYTQNDGGMMAIVLALNGDRVVFSYEQCPNASHDYSLEGFMREFTRQGFATSHPKGHNEAIQQDQRDRSMPLIDAKCRVEQTAPTLSVWLEATAADERDVNMIGAVMSLLEGVAEAMGEADSKLADYVMRDHREGKS